MKTEPEKNKTAFPEQLWAKKQSKTSAFEPKKQSKTDFFIYSFTSGTKIPKKKVPGVSGVQLKLLFLS
jgi:hypothetical protein